MAFNERNRPLEWWREENEVVEDNTGRKLTEAYADRPNNHFHAGDSGINPAPVMMKNGMSSGYADGSTSADASSNIKWDGLGKGNSTSHGKGTNGKLPKVKQESHRVREAFGDEEGSMDDGQDFEDEESYDDMPEDDVPEGVDDYSDEEGETVEVDGVTYVKQTILVPQDLGAMSGESNLEHEMGETPEEEAVEEDGVGAEDEDVTHPMESRKIKKNRVNETAVIDRIINKALNKTTQENAVKYFLSMKKYSEQKLKELFTGEYVINKQGETGFDFSPVAGDKDFAVVARAASGEQYTPTVSLSVREPDKSHKGGKLGHAVTPKQESSEEKFKTWLKGLSEGNGMPDSSTTPEDGIDDEYSSDWEYGNQSGPSNSEKDGEEASDHFNKTDSLANNLPGKGADTFPRMPQIKGGQKRVVSVNPESTNEKVQARQNRLARQQEGSDTKANKPTINESFDLKKAINGDY